MERRSCNCCQVWPGEMFTCVNHLCQRLKEGSCFSTNPPVLSRTSGSNPKFCRAQRCCMSVCFRFRSVYLSAAARGAVAEGHNTELWNGDVIGQSKANLGGPSPRRFYDNQLYTFVLYVMWKIDIDLLYAPFPQWCTENFLRFGFLWSTCWTQNRWWWSVTGFWCQYTGSVNIASQTFSSNSRLCFCGISPPQIEWIEEPGSLNSKIIRKYSYPPYLYLQAFPSWEPCMDRKGLTKLMFTKRCNFKQRSWATVILRTCWDKSCFLNSAEAVPFVAILTSICFFNLQHPFSGQPYFFRYHWLQIHSRNPCIYIYIIQFSVFPLSRFSTLCDIRPSCVWGQPLYQRAIIRIAPASKF